MKAIELLFLCLDFYKLLIMGINTNKINFGVVILAAGFSRRMNYPKPFLPANETKCYLEEIISKFVKKGVSEIVIVMNSSNYQTYKRLGFKFIETQAATIIINSSPENGRFSSIQAGVSALETDTPFFIQNVDNPYFLSQVIADLLHYSQAESFVVPTFNSKGGHPILLHNSLKDKIINTAYSSNFKVFLTGFLRINVPVSDAAILYNINTKEAHDEYYNCNN